LVWGRIVPDQDPSYSVVQPSQSSGFARIVPNQNPSYTQTQPTQSPEWGDVSTTSPDPNWENAA